MNITRMIAIPVLSAGILGGALGLASTAAAEVTPNIANDGHSIVGAHERKAPSVTDMSKEARKRDYRHGYLQDR